mmetsp:Transcript_26744/g.25763  ORF Transcript_26744/g.25763 Transcript_26744/m.25763 type:complete len:298 (-) Transcript_26744:1913-2806(-)
MVHGGSWGWPHGGLSLLHHLQERLLALSLPQHERLAVLRVRSNLVRRDCPPRVEPLRDPLLHSLKVYGGEVEVGEEGLLEEGGDPVCLHLGEGPLHDLVELEPRRLLDQLTHFEHQDPKVGFLEQGSELRVVDDASELHLGVIIDRKANLLDGGEGEGVVEGVGFVLEDSLADLVDVFVLFGVADGGLLELCPLHRVRQVVVPVLQHLHQNDHLLILQQVVLSHQETKQVAIGHFLDALGELGEHGLVEMAVASGVVGVGCHWGDIGPAPLGPRVPNDEVGKAQVRDRGGVKEGCEG